ncbi:hypothetical protein [Saccharopolyspora flava]|uniref:Uncharacterized protein n=1 Tax=Saccharopolyspora flava TaxID=95161 RepID=A0A1I6QSC7_9PSEU|nr:hypothetical protein [Saccharopolyspora flava]SFS55371.1 hypothetical protein SAMN05660874_01797 [Saccharopolyspora flava]
MTSESPEKKAERDRRRRLAEIFGDVLPETTSDDRPEPSGESTRESWYRENRPPHHDAR